MPVSVTKFIWKYISKLKIIFFTFVIGMTIGEFCTQQGLYYSSRIVGVISEEGNREILFRQALNFAFLFALFSLLRGFLHNGIQFLEARFRPILRVKISKALFNQAHKHSMQFFAEEMSGRVATKVRQTIREFDGLYGNGKNVAVTLIRITISFYFIAGVNLMLTLYLSLFFFFYLGFLYFNARSLIVYSERSYNQNTVANGVLVDTMFNYSLIKNYCRLLFEKLHYFKQLHKWVGAEKVVYFKEADMYMIQGVLRAVLQMIFLFIPFYYWLNKHISVADFVLVESLVTYICLYCMDIVGVSARMFRNCGGIKDGLIFLFKPLQVTDKPGAVKLNLRKAHINFQNVSFGYKNSCQTVDGSKTVSPLLFRHFNLDIKPGEKIGLVGHSGSGKSSLIKLIGRYYDLADGKITINGKNIADVTQESLRQNISLIPQDPSLFNRSILENIRYGNPHASDKEIIDAAERAYIHDFILKLPKGYQTRVGERGITLSGGERQRLAIARAILKNAPILILDEATSALDSESELYIQQALKNIMKNKTVIAIAHRLSTLREMDRLVVLDKGKIIEEGTHTSLLRKRGSYYEFYQLQAANFRR